MRAWYVFVVVGLILSAGMVTYGVMIEHQADQNMRAYLYNLEHHSTQPLQTHTVPAKPTHIKQTQSLYPTPTPTPTPACIRAITHCVVIGGKKTEKKDKPKFEIPKNYYHYPFRKYKPTYANLVRLLDGLKCPHKYNPNTFKCSHFAAWLEWYLENHGFKTDIIVLTWKVKGQNIPRISGHAIDKVYTDHGVVYVDPTLLSIGLRGKYIIISSPKSEIPPYAKLISIHTYHDIYALQRAIGYYQIDWWDILGYPPKVN